MGNTESSSSHCGPSALASLLLPRHQSADLVVKVEDDPSEVTFLTWLEEEDSSRLSPNEGNDDNVVVIRHSTSSNHKLLKIPKKGDKEQSSARLSVRAQLAQATERIHQLERLRKADQELVRSLNVKLKHLLRVQAEYFALQKQCEIGRAHV